MAAANLLALIDDIAAVLDDIAVLSKVAGKKTAGVLGDDLALNAQQVAGVRAERELPVVWAVAKGSFKNKLILVPAALLISALAPWAITPLLMIGGAFLCYEGFEKLAHKFLHQDASDKNTHLETLNAISDPNIDMVAFEKEKIKGAIRTDFILSAEIVVISLGAVQEATFAIQVAVVSGLALAITIGVYGIVAGIVKLDDLGLHLTKNTMKNIWGSIKRTLGKGLLVSAPYLMKTLSIVGTIAMFMVGGGILVHGIPHAHEILDQLDHFTQNLPKIGGTLSVITPSLFNTLTGIVLGGLVLSVVNMIRSIVGSMKSPE